MSTTWSTYPATYRETEVQSLLAAVQRGECAMVLGLSGAGKSNLLGFIAHRAAQVPHALVDCNRLPESSPAALWGLILRNLAQGAAPHPSDVFEALESSLAERLSAPDSRCCLIFDRFDALSPAIQPEIYGRLRALRDDHKYTLTYLVGLRRPLDPHSELAELFYAHTLWLGPLSWADARWSAGSYAARAGLSWPPAILDRLIDLSGAYPALLRAACEAYAAGCALEPGALTNHPAVQRRLEEFWSAQPTPQELRLSRLEGIPLLARPTGAPAPSEPTGFDTARLTAKELRLWETLQGHPNVVCEKDDLIRAVWPEDKVYLEGIRDDALAQLVRRLRHKVREQGGQSGWIQTVPGRGYKFQPDVD